MKKTKSLLTIILLFVLTFFCSTFIHAQEVKSYNMNIEINGDDYSSDNFTYLKNNEIYFYLIDLCNHVNIEVSWKTFVPNDNDTEGFFSIVKDNIKVELYFYDRNSPQIYEANVFFMKELDSIENPTIPEDIALAILGRFGFTLEIDKDNLSIKIEEINPINVFINGVQLQYDVNLLCDQNKPLLPMRAIFEHFGYSVGWEKNMTDEAVTIIDGKEYSFRIADNAMRIDGERYGLDSLILLNDGRTLLPIEALEIALDCSVEWDTETRNIYINSN